MRGVVVKCSMDRIRRATDEEWLGAELVKILSKDALEHMQHNGQRGYVDTSGEDPPPLEEENDPDDRVVGAEGDPMMDTLPISAGGLFLASRQAGFGLDNGT